MDEQKGKMYWVWYDTLIEDWFVLEKNDENQKILNAMTSKLKECQITIHEISSISPKEALSLVKNTFPISASPSKSKLN